MGHKMLVFSTLLQISNALFGKCTIGHFESPDDKWTGDIDTTERKIIIPVAVYGPKQDVTKLGKAVEKCIGSANRLNECLFIYLGNDNTWTPLLGIQKPEIVTKDGAPVFMTITYLLGWFDNTAFTLNIGPYRISAVGRREDNNLQQKLLTLTKHKSQLENKDWDNLQRRLVSVEKNKERITVEPNTNNTKGVFPTCWFEIAGIVVGTNVGCTELIIFFNQFKEMTNKESRRYEVSIICKGLPYVIVGLFDSKNSLQISKTHKHNSEIFEGFEKVMKQMMRKGIAGVDNNPKQNQVATELDISIIPRSSTSAETLEHSTLKGFVNYAVSYDDKHSSATMSVSVLNIGKPTGRLPMLYTVEILVSSESVLAVEARVDFRKKIVKFSKSKCKSERISGEQNNEEIFLSIWFSGFDVKETHKRQYTIIRSGGYKTTYKQEEELIEFSFSDIKPIVKNWNYHLIRFPGCAVIYRAQLVENNRYIIRNRMPGFEHSFYDLKKLEQEVQGLSQYSKFDAILVSNSYPDCSGYGLADTFPLSWSTWGLKNLKRKLNADGEFVEIVLNSNSTPLEERTKRIFRHPSNPELSALFGSLHENSTKPGTGTITIRQISQNYTNNGTDLCSLVNIMNTRNYFVQMSDNILGETCRPESNAWERVTINKAAIGKGKDDVLVLTLWYDEKKRFVESPEEMKRRKQFQNKMQKLFEAEISNQSKLLSKHYNKMQKLRGKSGYEALLATIDGFEVSKVLVQIQLDKLQNQITDDEEREYYELQNELKKEETKAKQKHTKTNQITV